MSADEITVVPPDHRDGADAIARRFEAQGWWASDSVCIEAGNTAGHHETTLGSAPVAEREIGVKELPYDDAANVLLNEAIAR